MLSGEFERKIRSLNHRLRIFCGDSDTTPAGLFHVVRGEYEQICAVDKNEVPELPRVYPNGMFYKAGWRRTINILLAKKLVDKSKAERVFDTRFGTKVRRPRAVAKPSLLDKYRVN